MPDLAVEADPRIGSCAANLGRAFVSVALRAGLFRLARPGTRHDRLPNSFVTRRVGQPKEGRDAEWQVIDGDFRRLAAIGQMVGGDREWRIALRIALSEVRRFAMDAHQRIYEQRADAVAGLGHFGLARFLRKAEVSTIDGQEFAGEL